MSGNIWAVLNNVEEDGKLKPKKKPVNKAKPAANQKPALSPNGKPQLTAKAARAFQQPKQQPKKKPQPAAAPAAAAKSPQPAAAPAAAKSTPTASAGKKGAAPQAKAQAPAMVVKPAAAAPVIQVRTLTHGLIFFKSPHPVVILHIYDRTSLKFCNNHPGTPFFYIVGSVTALPFVHDHCNPSTFHHP